MPQRMLIIQGHPDPNGTTFCHALADAYAEGALSAHAAIHRTEVARISFPLLRTKSEWEQGAAGTPESLQQAQDDLIWATHVAIVYPLWLGTMPALMKGFLEQVFRPDVALAYGESGFPRKLLTGRSARIVVTMGMPALAYRWYFGAHSLKSLERNILRFSGIHPIRETLFGMVDAVTPEKRSKWLDQMYALGRRDATGQSTWPRFLSRPARSGDVTDVSPATSKPPVCEGAIATGTGSEAS